MIEELHIAGLGVIEAASLRFAPGLTVMTGETGAGKTMLVTAVQLLLGARADGDLVRAGADLARAEAVIAPAPPQAGEWVDDGDDALVVAREIPVQGRSRARLGGRLVPASALSEALGAHIEVHTQHEHVRLARPEVQRTLLDRFAGDVHTATLARYRDAFSTWRALLARRDEIHVAARERARELDRLLAEVAEIEGAELDPEADGLLDQQLERLAHAEEIRTGTAAAVEALGSSGAGDALGIALDALRRLPVDDPELDELRSRAQGLAAEAAELAADVRAHGEAVDADPAHLAGLQERKRTVSGLARKYGAEIADVLAYATEARTRIEALRAAEIDAGTLEGAIDAARSELDALALEVRHGREVAAAALAEAVDGHLADLAMPHASFEVEVAALDGEPTAHGADRTTFLLAANPGEPPRPLATAASGGERSRVSLAVEVAFADVDDASVLVFDEVDAGIGGATAMAGGEKPARLAAGGRDGSRDARQVLCVTHLAQLAAFADVHHVVEKGLRGSRTVTTTREVAADARVAELARMLGGEVTGAAGGEHARELLDAARTRATR